MTDNQPPARWRSITYRVLMGIFILSFVVSTIAVWANYRIQNSDSWTETVAPLAADPAIQAYVVDQASILIEHQIRTDQEAGVLRDVAINQTMLIVRMLLNDFVSSQTFTTFWADANHLAHSSLLYVINGDDSNLIKTNGQNLVLDLQPVIDWLNPQLTAALPGSNYTVNLSPENSAIVLYSSQGVERIVRTFHLVDTLALVMPLVALASLVGALLVAINRKAACGQIGLVLTITAAVVLAAITITKVVLINNQPVTRQDAAGAFLRITFIDLVRSFRVTAIVGLVIYGVVALAQSRYVRDERVQAWLYQYREALAGGGIALATLYLVVSNDPRLWLTILCLVLIIGCASALIIWRKQLSAESPTTETPQHQ